MSSTTATPTKRPEDEYLGAGPSLGYGFQHVLTMYGGIIAPPLIVGGAAGLSTNEQALLVACCLFVGGLATVLQSFGIKFFGSKLPLVQGTSFAGVATMTAIVNGGGGIQAVFGAVMDVMNRIAAPMASRPGLLRPTVESWRFFFSLMGSWPFESELLLG